MKVFTWLDICQSLNTNNNIIHFLKSIFRFLPIQGQVHFANNIDLYDNNNQLEQLAKHLDTALLRPIVAMGGKTLAITLSTYPRVEDSIENLLSQDFDSATQQQKELRRACLQHDNHQYVVTKCWDFFYNNRPHGVSTADLEAVHIIPFALGNFREDERRQNADIWQCLYRYFPTIHNLFHHANEDVNRIHNVMMLAGYLHSEFGRLAFILEETSISGRYWSKIFPNFRNTFLKSHIPEFVTIIKSHDTRYPTPNKFLLAVHAAIGNILHTTGQGEVIAKIMEDVRGSGSHALVKDGSTDMEDLLSVTGLSLLTINPSHRSLARKEKHSSYTGPGLPGAESQPPPKQGLDNCLAR